MKSNKIIKIKFTGFPDYHNPREQPYYQYLSRRYIVEECDDPDYVIDGGQSFEHVKYNAIKNKTREMRVLCVLKN